MVCYQFNISGFICILNSEKLAEYPESLFSLLVNSQMSLERDNAGNIFINRNPTFGKIIYNSMVHDFKYSFLGIILEQQNYKLDFGNNYDLAAEFAYYGLRPVFTDTIRTNISYKIKSSTDYYGNCTLLTKETTNWEIIMNLYLKDIHCQIHIFMEIFFGNMTNDEFKKINIDDLLFASAKKNNALCSIGRLDGSYTYNDKKLLSVTIDELGIFTNGNIDINNSMLSNIQKVCNMTIEKCDSNPTRHKITYTKNDARMTGNFVYDLSM